MPKRSCPFADAAPLQLKGHVGLKMLSHGVFAERYSREVFGECGLPWVERATPRRAAGDRGSVPSAHGGCCFRRLPEKSESDPSAAERTSLARDRRGDWVRVGVMA